MRRVEEQTDLEGRTRSSFFPAKVIRESRGECVLRVTISNNVVFCLSKKQQLNETLAESLA